jgi:hypothetical protein
MGTVKSFYYKIFIARILYSGLALNAGFKGQEWGGSLSIYVYAILKDCGTVNSDLTLTCLHCLVKDVSNAASSCFRDQFRTFRLTYVQVVIFFRSETWTIFY